MKGGSIDRLPEVTGERRYRELGYRDEWQLHHQGVAMGYYARDIKATEAITEIVTENQACEAGGEFSATDNIPRRTRSRTADGVGY